MEPTSTKPSEISISPTLGPSVWESRVRESWVPELWSRKLHAIVSSELLMWLGLTLALTAVPLFFIKHAQLSDPDIWWHMRTGEWIIQHHAVPHVDPFSASTLGRSWVDYCWIFDVGSYLVVTRLGLTSILWFQAIMRVLVAATLFSLVRQLTRNFWKAAGLTLLGMAAMLWTFQPRPGAISVLFFVIELHILVSARKDPRRLWMLPALFVLWANIHIEFITGLFVLGVFCLEPLLDRLLQTTPEGKSSVDLFQTKLWTIFAASSMAVLVNPYGYKLIGNVLQYARDTKIYNIISEFHAMLFRTFNDWAVLALLMIGCFAFGRIRPFRPVWALLLAWSAWMGFRSMREVWLVAILCVIVAAILGHEQNAEPAKELGLSLRVAVSVFVCLVLLAGAGLWPFSSKLLLRQVAERFPVGAATYIRQNHLHGPLLNELTWGGFLIYAVPEVPVAIDGRTNVHSQDEIINSIRLWSGAAGWQDRPEIENANLVITDRSWSLALLLRSDPRFRIAYEDNTTVLFEAVHQQNAGNRMVPQTP
jgi:hypothetical protein